jgi:membrane associated rhomboid family serine protease
MSDFKFTRPNAFPPVVKNLIIINVLVFVAQQTLGTQFNLEERFALHDIRSVYFEPYQIVTHLFMHGSLSHILFNMLALWMFGAQLENYWGPKRFFIFYFVSGLGAALLHLFVVYIELTPVIEQFKRLPMDIQLSLINDPQYKVNIPTVGASGAVFGCLAAYGYLFPNTIIYLYFAIPVKAKWFVIFYAALELYLGIQNSAGDNVAHFAHLGGALAGIILVFIWNKTNRKTLY